MKITQFVNKDKNFEIEEYIFLDSCKVIKYELIYNVSMTKVICYLKKTIRSEKIEIFLCSFLSSVLFIRQQNGSKL